MKIKRFFAEDMRSALKQVKEALGPDAVILSNRRVDGGVELVTAVDYDPTAIRKIAYAPDPSSVSQKKEQQKNNHSRQLLNDHPLLKEAAAKIKNKPIKELDTFGVSSKSNNKPKASSSKTHAQMTKSQESAQQFSSERLNALIQEQEVKVAEKVKKYDLVDDGSDIKVEWSEEPTLVAMRRELTSLRGLLEHQLSGLAWADMERRSPAQVMLLRRLSEMGLEATICRKVAKRVNVEGNIEHLWRQALQVLSRLLKVCGEDVLLDGGITALVGPTGVGKTTTIAKLAARYALHHGASEVALITTDTYRIAAHEQLKTYGRILGVPVRMVGDAGALRSALYEFRERSLILIDTAGMSQHDERLSDQLNILYEGGPHVKRYLTLSTTSQVWGLEEAVKAFEPKELDGCLLTKLDESTSIGGAISTAIQYDLPVTYITDGQRVPEDLKVARAHNLINRALTLMQKRYREVTDDALAMVFARGEEHGREVL
ncbi:Flagella-associated GTP-binding protein [Piscirickettsia salmonis]|uniref:flagellar biosynthesis protein FlhF n=1 Tax=Piscirickettsia salmonis TaxID=1238 RepID=UPI0012B90690|nr:flagellar biosynthesis protein FlhF [Piscirickettsia salmonis]QGP50210.1 Flagella-associated GTP-binding protein [Piscirickettsia salmonis]QGP54681.1 Flagella-associated GTP-binding protein [Piscirickettsia salmonis]QGP59422.1 Flagella-associated GTP-binding protein [Piscirickettsia salmonis]QGP64122.1 Flagella-associated GTP-binding protein [Piscirickettsia salmonis]